MTDPDAFYTTGCGNCACSRVSVIHAGGCPRALHSQLRNESPEPGPEPDEADMHGPLLTFSLWLAGVGGVAFVRLLMAHRLGWV